MGIIYVHTFHAIGVSSDTKPTTATEGMVFWELDTQKVYLFHAGQWRGIIAGAGSWSPAAAETLTNKTIVLNNNIVKTTSGNIGIFAFTGSGDFAFVPVGSANHFLKVNNSGTGFEFADPATSGSWNPSAVETLTNKTVVVENNTVKQTTPAAGALLADNGTKFIPLAKGANNTYLGVNNSGVLGFYATSGLGGGGGGSSPSSGLTRPSQVGFKEGWWDGGTVADHEKAHGILDGELQTTTTNAPSVLHHTTRGKYIRFPCFSTGDNERVRIDSLMFKRNYSSYHLLKFRISQNVSFAFFTGFDSDTDDNMDSALDLNDESVFMIGKTEDNANFKVFSNAATSNVTATPLTSNPFNTDPHTVEVQADPTNNRFQYRVDDFPNGTWNNVTTNIPLTDIPMGLVTSIYSKTSTDFDFEVYLLEAANKVMF